MKKIDSYLFILGGKKEKNDEKNKSIKVECWKIVNIVYGFIVDVRWN